MEFSSIWLSCHAMEIFPLAKAASGGGDLILKTFTRVQNNEKWAQIVKTVFMICTIWAHCFKGNAVLHWVKLLLVAWSHICQLSGAFLPSSTWRPTSFGICTTGTRISWIALSLRWRSKAPTGWIFLWRSQCVNASSSKSEFSPWTTLHG